MEKKNNAIEFYRFACSLLVMFYHAELMTAWYGKQDIFGSGGSAVVFFGVLSGFLFAGSFKKSKMGPSPFRDAVLFWGRKAVSFALLWYLCLFVTLLVRLHYYQFDRMQTVVWLRENWAEFFMLNSVFYKDNHINGPTWYISALLWVGTAYFFLFAFLKKHTKMSVPLVALGAAIGLHIAVWAFGFRLFGRWEITYFAMLFPCGVVCRGVYEKIRGSTWPCAQKWFLQAGELFAFAAFWAFFFWAPLRELPTWLWQTSFEVVCMSLVCITFLGKTVLTRILNNQFSALLGKFSMGIYMSHMMLLVRWGWAPPFDVATEPLCGYITIGVEAVLLGAVFSLLDVSSKTALRALRSRWKKTC